MSKVVLSILVNNTSGVLSRVAGLFSRRGYNIDSLTVGVTADPRYSRATIVTRGDNTILDQIEKQLYKLEDVIWVTDQGQPLILIDIGEESDMDAEMVETCEECERDADNLEGQMQIEDFPEVMP